MGKKKVVQKKEEGSAVKKVITPIKKTKNIDTLCIYINATYNNIIITATDKSGKVLCWASAGSLGFSGPKKATPFAASKVVSAIIEKIKTINFKDMEIYVKGVGAGRDSAIRALANENYNIVLLKDVTPIPHNGPRPPKVRRV